MKKPRVMPDTNILISALILWSGKPRDIFNKSLNGEITFILSEELLEELIEVLNRPKFSLITNEEKTDFLKNIKEFSQLVSPYQKFNIILKDPEDNKVLEAAVEGDADYIITGDEHLLELKEFRNIKIVNAKEFLDINFT